MGQATLFLMVGLPGSGKTTRAKELERETGAIRFTPDEWHLFLFGDDFHDPQEHELHNQRHDKVEALMWQVGKRLLAQGVSVILDFGFWAKEQREEKFLGPGPGRGLCNLLCPRAPGGAVPPPGAPRAGGAQGRVPDHQPGGHGALGRPVPAAGRGRAARGIRPGLKHRRRAFKHLFEKFWEIHCFSPGILL